MRNKVMDSLMEPDDIDGLDAQTDGAKLAHEQLDLAKCSAATTGLANFFVLLLRRKGSRLLTAGLVDHCGFFSSDRVLPDAEKAVSTAVDPDDGIDPETAWDDGSAMTGAGLYGAVLEPEEPVSRSWRAPVR